MLRLAASLSTVLPAAVLSTPRILSRTRRHRFPPKSFSRNNFSTIAAAACNQIGRCEHVKASTPEIKSEKLTQLLQKTAPAVPADFPFSVSEKPSDEGSGSFFLFRKFNGEDIYLSIHKPEDIRHYSGVGRCEHKLNCGGQVVELLVIIIKGNEKAAAFGVSMCSNTMRVHFMSVTDDDTHEVDSKGKLQEGLQEYLKARGVEPRYAEYMYKYVVWRFVEKPMIKFIKE